MAAYYSENNPYAAAWLRALIADGLIPDGRVDERSIADVLPEELAEYTSWHLFAGIAGWPLALRLAGWPDDRPILTGSCPCFAAGTLVLSEAGYRPIEDLVVGDTVLTHLGRWRRITATMDRDNAALVRVRAQGVPDIITTAEHPFYARTNWRAGHIPKKYWSEPSWVAASGLTRRTYLGQVLPGESGASDHSSDFWWMVGRYLACGWRAKSKRIIICANDDKLERLSLGIRQAGYSFKLSRERTVNKLAISDAWLFDFLGQFGDGAAGKRLPRLALELDRGRSTSLINGYLEGDGSRYERSATCGWSATTVSRSLALGIALLAQRSHGVVASVRRCPMPPATIIEGRTVNQRDFYQIRIPDHNRSAFVDGDYGWKLVRAADPAGVGRVHNISVEEDESYCADGAVVHNCQPFSVAGKGLGHDDPRHLWPHMFRIIRALRPEVVMGEQVAGALGYAWLDGVHADLASENYTSEAVDIPAGSVNAPHIRNRLYWVAHPDRGRCQQPDARDRSLSIPDAHQSDVRLDHAASTRCHPAGRDQVEALRDGAWSGEPERRGRDGGPGRMGDAQPPQRGPHAEGRSDVHDRADAGWPQAPGGPQLAGQLPDRMGDSGGTRPPPPKPEDLPGTRRWDEGGATPESGSAPRGLDHAAGAGWSPDGRTGEPWRAPDDAPRPGEDGGLADPDGERRQQIPGSAPGDEAANGGARWDALEPRSDHQPSGDDEGPLWLADPASGGRRILRQPPGEDGLPDRSHAHPRPVGDADLLLPGDRLLQRSRQLGGSRLHPQVDPRVGPWDEWTLIGPDPKGKYRRVGLTRRPFRGVVNECAGGSDGLRPIDLLSKGQVQRVNKLRCLGNGLVIELAAEVIRAYMETHP